MAASKEFLSLAAASKISLHVNHDQLEKEFSNDPQHAWCTDPEIPSASDLMAESRALPPNNVLYTLPESRAQYLRLHYELCRYEAIEPLRAAVAQVRQEDIPLERDYSKGFVYSKVKPIGILLSKQGACIRISFSTDLVLDHVNWKDSNRLTPGNLVALSPKKDNFRTTCIVATVATRSFNGEPVARSAHGSTAEDLPRIELFFSDPCDIPFNSPDDYIMVEANVGYFESLRHTMLGLQQAALYRAPLDKYIFDQPRSLEPPARAANSMSPAVNPSGVRIVVPATASTFDRSQREAFDAMTTQEFSIVQGPPGTGKTHTSVVTIQSYVETLKRASPRMSPPPIVIAAETNHALDQILELCLDQGVGKLVRLGGQSRSPRVTEHSMFRLRSGSTFRKADSSGHSALKTICAAIGSLMETYSRDVVYGNELCQAGLITPEQYMSLLGGYEVALEDDDGNPLDDIHKVDIINARCILAWVSSFSQQSESVDIRSMLPSESRGATEQRLDDTLLSCDIESEGEALPGNGPEDAAFRHGGIYLPLTQQPDTIGSPPTSRTVLHHWTTQSKELLEKHSDLYDISQRKREMVYYYLKMKMREGILAVVRRKLQEYSEVYKMLKINRWINNMEIIKFEGIQIVGCTMTGLAKYRGLISALMPRIMLIEEAAETREANIAAAMFPSLRQLALVGDHQQLVPHVTVHLLSGPPFNLKVSMFERLVRLSFPLKTLQVQRRMIPQIREIVQTFYPTLQDHPSVLDAGVRPPVEGMGATPLWWYRHERPHMLETTSVKNSHEAEMIVGFLKYLMISGVRPHQVTILAYYSAQVALISQLIDSNTFLRKMRATWSIRTVDGFQGEENDIIILSLVRSVQGISRRGDVGFVKDENRCVVALSRARRGLYVFGNPRPLLKSSPQSKETWRKVINAFGTHIGDHLPVTCKHHGILTPIKAPREWSPMPLNGCMEPFSPTPSPPRRRDHRYSPILIMRPNLTLHVTNAYEMEQEALEREEREEQEEREEREGRGGREEDDLIDFD